MINAIIVEDEWHNRNNLIQLFGKYCPDINILADCGNADEALKLISDEKPDLVFLDIQMPEKDGFEMLKEIGRYNFEIIFITAYSAYVIDAIKFSAIDYLLKPVNIEELKIAVQKAQEKINLKRENVNLKNLLAYLQNNNKSEHRIAITSLREIRFIEVQEIIRCESENTYTSFFMNSGEKILSTKPIIAYEELLVGYGFLRCHQSHLVNKKYVTRYLKKDGYSLVMYDESIIPISRQKREWIKAALLS